MIFGFGKPGSHNTINVLRRSPMFARLTEQMLLLATIPSMGMNTNLVGGIYAPWATFSKTISDPVGQKKSHFSQRYEASRKNVERAFGVLQNRFAVLHGPTKQWDS